MNIWCFDDDEINRDLYTELFSKYGEVNTFESIPESFGYSGHVDFIMVDMSVIGGTGNTDMSMLYALMQLHPGSSVILISALPEEYIKSAFSDEDFKKFRSVRIINKMHLVAIARNNPNGLFSYTEFK